MSRLINSVASVQRQRPALWPAHTVISSGISRTEAGPATVWMSACCKGNGRAGSFTSASSSIKRLLTPLASLPGKASVRPVFFPADDERADRKAALEPEPAQETKAGPTWQDSRANAD